MPKIAISQFVPNPESELLTLYPTRKRLQDYNLIETANSDSLRVEDADIVLVFDSQGEGGRFLLGTKDNAVYKSSQESKAYGLEVTLYVEDERNQLEPAIEWPARAESYDLVLKLAAENHVFALYLRGGKGAAVTYRSASRWCANNCLPCEQWYCWIFCPC